MTENILANSVKMTKKISKILHSRHKIMFAVIKMTIKITKQPKNYVQSQTFDRNFRTKNLTQNLTHLYLYSRKPAIPGGGTWSRFWDCSLAIAAGDLAEGMGINLEDESLFCTSYWERIALILGSSKSSTT